MADDKHLTPYEEFNLELPEDEFPSGSVSPRAAAAIIEAAMWTDANPMLNLSSFVTTYMEPEVTEIMSKHAHINYVDHDMYPVTYAMEQRMVKWLWEIAQADGTIDRDERNAVALAAQLLDVEVRDSVALRQAAERQSDTDDT